MRNQQTKSHFIYRHQPTTATKKQTSTFFFFLSLPSFVSATRRHVRVHHHHPLLPFTKKHEAFYCRLLLLLLLFSSALDSLVFSFCFSSPFAAPTFPAKPGDCVTCVIRLVSPVSTTFHQAPLTPKHSRRLFGFSHFWVGTSGALCVCPYPPIN